MDVELVVLAHLWTRVRAKHTHQTLLIIISLQNVCDGMLNYEPLLYLLYARAIAGTLAAACAAVFASKAAQSVLPMVFCFCLFLFVLSRHKNHNHQQRQRFSYAPAIAELSMKNGVERMQVRLRFYFPQNLVSNALLAGVMWFMCLSLCMRCPYKRKIITNRSAQMNDLWPIIG